MFVLKSSDHILIDMIRTAGNPTVSKDGVQIAKSFLESLSEEQASQLEEIKNSLGPDAFRNMIFQAVGGVESEEELAARKREEERKIREDMARQKFNMPEDRPVALPEDEHIMLKDEKVPHPYIPTTRGPVMTAPRRPRLPQGDVDTQVQTTPDFDISKPINITKRDPNDKNWWDRFNRGPR